MTLMSADVLIYVVIWGVFMSTPGVVKWGTIYSTSGLIFLIIA